jgi:hypothetical protein
MAEGLQELVRALQLAAAGNSVPLEYVRSLKFGSTDELVERAATQSWRRLVHFADDTDIRSKDGAYDDQLKQEMMWRAQELARLLSERDPDNRKEK